MLRATRTYTRYFGDDDLAPIRAAWVELARDAEERIRFIDDEVRTELEERLSAVHLAINRLGDRVS